MASPFQFQSIASSGAPSSSGTGKNYLGTVNNVKGNGNAELGTTVKWSLGITGALTNGLPTAAPTFGSGSSGDLSLTVQSLAPLAGTYSFQYSSSAATTVGDCLASDAFTIDQEDRAKVMTVKFYFQPSSNPSNGNWSGTSSNSFAWAIYDVTNSAWIIPTGAFGMTQSSGVGLVTGTFQTPANGSQFRLVVYNANASAGAITMQFDDFSVGPQTAPIGAPQTDWVGYTPTFSAGFGTVSNSALQWRRIGPNLHIRGTFQLGTVAGSIATFSLPSGMSSVATSPTTFQVYGTWEKNVATATAPKSGVLTLTGTSATVVGFASTDTAGSNNPFAQENGGTLFGNSQVVNVRAEIPISGWSSNVQMSSDTDTRVVSAKISKNGNQAVNGEIKVTSWTVEKDRAGLWDASNNRFNITIAGDYNLSINTYASPTTTATQVAAYKINGGSTVFIGTDSITAGSARFGGTAFLPGLVPGDYVEIYHYSSAATTVNSGSSTTASIFRLSGPSVIAASESAGASYGMTVAQAVGANAVIKYDTKITDYHNTYSTSTGLWTCASTGRYRISVVGAAGASAASAYVKKNGTGIGYLTTFIAASLNSGAIEIPLLAGDTIGIYSDSAVTFVAPATGGFQNRVDITRVGN